MAESITNKTTPHFLSHLFGEREREKERIVDMDGRIKFM